MKLRCPYCKGTFDKPVVTCPHCGRTMVIPGSLRKMTLRQRKEARERIYRDAERRERELMQKRPPDIAFARSPMGIVLLMGVLIVIGAMVIGRSMVSVQPNRITRSKQSIAAKEARNLRIAVERYRQDIGHYPTEEERGLLALIYNPGVWGWRRPYLNLIRPDPWGTHYAYMATSNRVTLFSCGPDRKPHTADDIAPPEPTPEEIKRRAENILPRYRNEQE